MPNSLEAHRGGYTISTDPARLDFDAIAEMLSRSYWAHSRKREDLERALHNSLVFGLYEGASQVGLARVVTDYGVFAYLCDVIIHEDHRGLGLGRWLLATVHEHPDLQNLRRWLLITRDAHGLYDQFNWTPLGNPEQWMERFFG
jgi:GNAT superfamily N-acetyltransferase